MDLDDLKARLAEQDAKLDTLVRLNAANVRELRLSKTRSGLRRLVPGLVVELVVAVAAVVWLGDFAAEHVREPRFLLPALLVDACAVALLGSCARQLAAVATLDYGGAVVAVQKEVARLRLLRLRTAKWSAICWFVLWFPALVVLARGALGVDLWTVLGAVAGRDARFFAWAVGNAVFGVAAALLVAWAWNRYAGRADRSPAVRRVMDAFAGRAVAEAARELDAIAEFEAGD